MNLMFKNQSELRNQMAKMSQEQLWQKKFNKKILDKINNNKEIGYLGDLIMRNED